MFLVCANLSDLPLQVLTGLCGDGHPCWFQVVLEVIVAGHPMRMVLIVACAHIIP